MIVIAAFALLVPAPAVNAVPLDTYCSPSGDLCTGVFERDGRIKLQIHTFSLRGHYHLCVRQPNHDVRCHRFRLERHGKIYKDVVDWARNFPHGQSGHYRVRWFKLYNHLGPALQFSRT
jgi:hypothetical protein